MTALVVAVLAFGSATPAHADETGPASIGGIITGPDGAAMPDVDVTLYIFTDGRPLSHWQSVKSNAAGEYEITDLPATTFKMRFTPDDPTFATEWWGHTADSRSSVEISIARGQTLRGIDVQLSLSGSITGTISASGPESVGVAFVTVELYVRRDDGGFEKLNGVWPRDDHSYSFSGLLSGEYTIRVEPREGSSYASEWWNNRPRESVADSIVVEGGHVTEHIDVQLEVGATITGMITGEAGKPPGFVDAVLYDLSDGTAREFHTVHVSAPGQYTFFGVPDGTYAVKFQPSDSYFDDEWWHDAIDLAAADRVHVTRGDTIRGIDAELAAKSTISGVVRGSDGAPAAQAVVELYDTNDSQQFVERVWTDASGAYTLAGIDAGRYHLRILAPSGSQDGDQWWDAASGLSSAEVIEVGERDHLTADPSLRPGAVISGTVTDDAGAPLKGVGVEVELIGGTDHPIAIVSTNDDGRYEIFGLEPQDYRVYFRPPWGVNMLQEWWENASSKASSTAITLSTSEIRSGVDVVLETGAAIEGTVMGIDGKPAWNTRVQTYRLEENGWYMPWKSAYVDQEGHYSIIGLISGSYAVGFDPPPASPYEDEFWNDHPDSTEFDPIELVAGQAPVTIDATLIRPADIRYPEIFGTATVGSTLTAVTSSEDLGAQITYQWFADDAPLDGATGRDLLLTPDLLGETISVEVRATLTGYPDGTNSSAMTEPVGLGLLTAPTPTITGSASTGSTLTVKPGSWTTGTTFAYQWYANGTAISGATASTLALTSAHAGKTITVRVTGSKPAYTTVSKSSAATSKVFLASTPTISGTAAVGSTLTAKPGTWATGTTLKYQWYASGSTISGATGSTFKPASSQAGKQITVRVTGSLSGYTTTARTSTATPKVITAGAPTISGTAATGSTLTAKPGTWTTGTRFTYQWYANGTTISGATASTFKPTSTQAGKTITVRVTGSQTGYATASKTSPATGKVYLAPTPTITGTPAVGATLTATAGTWTTGSTLTYQWYASGTAITGATAKTLKLSSSQAGKQITVRVTGSLSGYTTTARTSTATPKVITAGAPTISGSAATGSTLTAKPGTWTTGTRFTYQWYANGAAVSGATASTFKPASVQAGKTITVRITGSQTGYATVSKTSAATSKVYLAPTPTITGTPAVGSTLTASAGTWTTGSTLTYQWYASGTAITGATAKTLKLSSSQAGMQITVRVTGSLTGYPTTSRISAATLKVATVGTPTITGTAVVGSTLTAKPGTWTTGTAFTFQWYVNGAAVEGATSPSFIPSVDQLDQQLSVELTGSLVGYATVVAASVPTPKVVDGTPTVTPVE
ncbi:carboxypeptidase regulatory-like domain-containing protein [Agromyces endophyticus]|uniref:carboxypeptidase regulatory-like domain-containing protein n=1 Tax=Agromyces sp. H17E-10 TaxID=2932244 RepID=UPI001FD3B24F|nr:carboxypeptidase regulatory-like domain-containing protein [Agromyces sp. H17E-10]UOQ90942.1 carboxypeptidase regulatory-like domain-containing protein [Agromyces sp. H17E-10]